VARTGMGASSVQRNYIDCSRRDIGINLGPRREWLERERGSPRDVPFPFPLHAFVPFRAALSVAAVSSEVVAETTVGITRIAQEA
jgi:hypothetical protein